MEIKFYLSKLFFVKNFFSESFKIQVERILMQQESPYKETTNIHMLSCQYRKENMRNE